MKVTASQSGHLWENSSLNELRTLVEVFSLCVTCNKENPASGLTRA